jgi:hypothetical protein
MAASARSVHLVGSVPFANAGEVFEVLAKRLGPLLKRIPDGETGERAGFGTAQYKRVLSRHEAFEPAPQPRAQYQAYQPLRLKPGRRAEDIHFESLGYAQDIIQDSYPAFLKLRAAGKIDQRHRMLIALPTPLAPIAGFMVMEDQAAVEPAYEEALARDIAQIAQAIPARDLAFQWDVAREFMFIENFRKAPFDNLWGGLADRFTRYIDYIPDEAEVGFHLCYGNQGRRHFLEPADTGNLVRVANLIADGASRAVDWIHMPVPRNRDDEAYFAPLAGLRLQPQTELSLGLLHIEDGFEGARRRMEAASRFRSEFSLSTECGLSGRPRDEVMRLIELHVIAATTG